MSLDLKYLHSNLDSLLLKHSYDVIPWYFHYFHVYIVRWSDAGTYAEITVNSYKNGMYTHGL